MSVFSSNRGVVTAGQVLPVVVASMGGAYSSDIDSVVHESVSQHEGFTLRDGENWLHDRGGEKIICSSDSENLRNRIAEAALRNENPKAVFIVGKSSGGMLAWNTLRLYYASHFRHWFQRCALVLVDPHGAVTGDGRFGPYCDSKDLWWPPGWPTDRSVFRVYNIFQQQHSGVVSDFVGAVLSSHVSTADTLTGASFGDARVCENIRLTEEHVSLSRRGLHHMNITHNSRTRQLIRRAFSFARAGL